MVNRDNVIAGDEAIGNDKGYEVASLEEAEEFAKKRNEDYDVVIDTLQKKIDALWKMTKSNMDNDMMNIMDDIRLEQISQLEKAITMWLSTTAWVST
jgi:prefoldin subunit 5